MAGIILIEEYNKKLKRQSIVLSAESVKNSKSFK
jgi:hypothetical protein